MKLQKNVDLLSLNTFHVAALASQFVVPKDQEDLLGLKALLPKNLPILVLGEGANILFTKDFDGLILKNELKGRKIISEDEESVVVELASGENWHEFVMWAANEGWSGMENMAYIPGTVGAAPVQNIAAYGQNFEDIFHSLEGIYLDSFEKTTFTKEQCKFAYRESVFKKELRGKFLVSSVRVKLSKVPLSDTSYHELHRLRFSLQSELDKAGKKPPYSSLDIAETIISIRKFTQPDWHKVGTAGSFFKNPVVTKEKFMELSTKVTDLQSYPIDKLTYPMHDDPTFDHANHVKVPAGRLLDELGWKGKVIGKVSTHSYQALSIVNLGGATGKEVFDFSEQMREDILKNYDIELEREVIVL